MLHSSWLMIEVDDIINEMYYSIDVIAADSVFLFILFDAIGSFLIRPVG